MDNASNFMNSIKYCKCNKKYIKYAQNFFKQLTFYEVQQMYEFLEVRGESAIKVSANSRVWDLVNALFFLLEVKFTEFYVDNFCGYIILHSDALQPYIEKLTQDYIEKHGIVSLVKLCNLDDATPTNTSPKPEDFRYGYTY
uniref:Uncharacterized protein n=1 Tax=Euglena viridis TaxID=3040 RepID=M1ETR5_EUGVI|nr:hypothetical protein I642_p068 [Euglena viridis]AEY70777.1 hypothetical protein [Euglena viridis]